MKRISTKLIMILALLLVIQCAMSTAFANDESIKDNNEFRVVGYYTASAFDEPLERLQLDKLTHIMYGFCKLTNDGDLIAVEKLDKLKELVPMAHEKNVKVFIAIGGVTYQNVPLATTFTNMARNDDSRKKFIDSVVEFVQEYNLDGAEIDWEYPQKDTGDAFEALIVDLADALHNIDKELSAAVAGAASVNDKPETSRMISSKAMNAIDFIEIMAYDLPTTNGGNHSPLWYAQQSLAYWGKQGLDTYKIVLGMPLYARPSWYQYRHLVGANPDFAYQNFVEAGIVSKLDSTYNGLPLLHDKTVLALSKNSGGIMFFDINEDTEDEYSALSMIDRLVKLYKGTAVEEFEKLVWIYVNNRPVEFSLDDDYGVPFIDSNQRTLIPLRKAFECIGADVDYNPNGKIITIKKDDTTVTLAINSQDIYVNGEQARMDTNAVLINSRTYIPARVVFEAFGYKVSWQSAGRSVYIEK